MNKPVYGEPQERVRETRLRESFTSKSFRRDTKQRDVIRYRTAKETNRGRKGGGSLSISIVPDVGESTQESRYHGKGDTG